MGELIIHALGVVARVAYELLTEVLLFQLGRGAFLLLTLGRYPRGKALERHSEHVIFAGLLAAAGLVGAAIAWRS